MKKINYTGATCIGSNMYHFKVWAPEKESVKLHIVHPSSRMIEMQKDHEGYFSLTTHDVPDDARYYFSVEGKDLPDPTSYFQPEGVHGPSQVVDHTAFRWTDADWKGLPLKDLILYELHVGTFTKEGTFEAIIGKLDHLLNLGVNAIELLPVSQFPGDRNWGYDGVYPYAVQNSYGDPKGLKKLVDACHAKGIAVFLDVVYNHLGPEGNYLISYGPYFTKKYSTPWGDAINYDDAWCDGVREYFSNNALYWLEHFHLDGLRLDAIHMVFDNSAVHFWDYTNSKVKDLQQRLGRSLHMIAESDLNNPRVINDRAIGGYGFSAQWLDDFHHALYVMLDDDGRKRYYDFGTIEQLAKAYKEGFVHSGEFVKFRKRKHGSSSAGIPGERFVAFNLNHDQVGNRVNGERLCVLVDHERLKIAAAALILSPYIPMLFMGEEYADKSPFYYFVSHSDPQLVEAVRKGRKEEFKDYKDEVEPPDPQDRKTFEDSKLKWEKVSEREHAIIFNWHKKLIEHRTSLPALASLDKNDVHTFTVGQSLLAIHRQSNGSEHALLIINFSEREVKFTIPGYSKFWKKILDSLDSEWQPHEVNVNQLRPSVEEGAEVSVPPTSFALFTGVGTFLE